MNISDINKNIYGCKSLKEGENIDLIMKLVEEQQMKSANFLNLNNDSNIFKEIKF